MLCGYLWARSSHAISMPASYFLLKKERKRKHDYYLISPKEVLLLLMVGYFHPQWFVLPVIIQFLVMREYFYVSEWGDLEALSHSILSYLYLSFWAIPVGMWETPFCQDGEDAFAELPRRWGQVVCVSLFLFLLMAPLGHTTSWICGSVALWHGSVKYHCFPVAHGLDASSYLAVFSFAKSLLS